MTQKIVGKGGSGASTTNIKAKRHRGLQVSMQS